MSRSLPGVVAARPDYQRGCDALGLHAGFGQFAAMSAANCSATQSESAHRATHVAGSDAPKRGFGDSEGDGLGLATTGDFDLAGLGLLRDRDP